MTLSRGKPLKRVPFVSRSAPLKSGGFLKRGAFIARTAIKAKPQKVTPEERAAKKVLKGRSGLVCECCGRRRGNDFSHRVNEGQGGPWTASNGMHACRLCHDWIGDNLLLARERGWYLRSFEDFRAIPVQHAWLGLVLLHDDGSTTRYEENAA